MLILHGDDQAASRKQLLQLKAQARQSGQQLIDLPGSDLTLAQLATAAASASLLGSTNAIFIENLFSRRPSNEKKALTDYLKTHTHAHITVWENKNLSPQLTAFPTSTIRRFDLPKVLFKFLSDFTLPLLQQTLTTTPPEQLLALIARRLEDLLLVKSGIGDFPSWQKSQLQRQAVRFTPQQLARMATSLLDIDYRQKNSLSPAPLAVDLELWLLRHIH